MSLVPASSMVAMVTPQLCLQGSSMDSPSSYHPDGKSQSVSAQRGGLSLKPDIRWNGSLLLKCGRGLTPKLVHSLGSWEIRSSWRQEGISHLVAARHCESKGSPGHQGHLKSEATKHWTWPQEPPTGLFFFSCCSIELLSNPRK